MKKIGPALTAIHEICSATNSGLWIYNMDGKMMFNKKKPRIEYPQHFRSQLSGNEWNTLMKMPVGITTLYIRKEKKQMIHPLLQICFLIRHKNGDPFCFCAIENDSEEYATAKKILFEFQNKIGIPCRMRIVRS